MEGRDARVRMGEAVCKPKSREKNFGRTREGEGNADCFNFTSSSNNLTQFPGPF